MLSLNAGISLCSQPSQTSADIKVWAIDHSSGAATAKALTCFAAKGFELDASVRVNEKSPRTHPEEDYAQLFLSSLNDSGRAL